MCVINRSSAVGGKGWANKSIRGPITPPTDERSQYSRAKKTTAAAPLLPAGENKVPSQMAAASVSWAAGTASSERRDAASPCRARTQPSDC